MKINNILSRFQKKLRYKIKEPVYIPVESGEHLKNKNVLITGGASGIGFAIAEACLRSGASVLITGRSQSKLENAKKLLMQENEYTEETIFILVMDLQEVESIDNKLNIAISLFPNKRIDILVNNAGISIGENIGNTEIESYERVLDTNLKGTYFISQSFSNYLINRNLKGNILNISSSSSVRPAISPYMISKWGEVGLTQGLAKKLISYDIVVNGIAPGPTATDMLNKDGTDLMYENSPTGRYASPKEIANLAIFMISDMGRMIVGETVYITGGSGTLTVDDIKY